jgi:RNA polymerase sigma-32 factor
VNLVQKEHIALCRKAKRGDRKAADRLVRLVLPYVHLHAHRVQKKTGMTDHDALVSEGCMGVLKAIQKFDPKAGCGFLTYATWWIRAAMSRGVEDAEALFSGTKHTHRNFRPKVREVAILIESGMGPAEARARVAKKHGIALARFDEMFASLHIKVSPFDPPESEDNGAFHFNHDTLPRQHTSHTEAPDDDADRKRIQAAVREVVKDLEPSLNAKERAILHRRLFTHRNDSLKDIGDPFGVTRERIRQIELKLVKKLRSRLSKHRAIRESVGFQEVA